jgi:Na+/H+ antiporter NhaD/arsenite permease-like protein
MTPYRFIAIVIVLFASLLVLACGAAAQGAPAEAHAADAGHADIGVQLPIWTVLPFVALLLAIAVLPLAAEHWWHSNRNKACVAGGLAAVTAVYVVAAYRWPGVMAVLHVLTEYVSFILLLSALFVISGGIVVKGSLSGTPLANTVLLAIGAVLANVIGTTGASVLLVRPLLRACRSNGRCSISGRSGWP